MMNKKYFLTFADWQFKLQKERLLNQAKQTGWFDYYKSYSPESISELVSEHKHFFLDNSLGFGLWIWKPYIIKKLLSEIDDGDFIFYLDSGATVISHKEQRFSEYCEFLNQSEKPIIAFAVPHYREIEYQKIDLLNKFNLQNDQEFLQSPHIEAGVIILRKSEFSVKFVDEWLTLMIHDNYNFAKHPKELHLELSDYIDYRNDQSVFSLLYKVRGIKIWKTETYGTGPFFASRMSDYNLKLKAPEKYWMREDFDPDKHPNWSSFHNDETVRNSISNELKQALRTIWVNLRFGSTDLKWQFLNPVMQYLDEIQDSAGLDYYQLDIVDFFPCSAKSTELLIGKVELYFILANSVVSIKFEMTSECIEFPAESIKQTERFSITCIKKQRVPFEHDVNWRF